MIYIIGKGVIAMATGTEAGKAHVPVWVYILLGVGLFLTLVGLMFVAFAPRRDHLTSVAEGVVSRVEVKKTRVREEGVVPPISLT